MKILLVNGFLRERTGSEVYLADLAEGIINRGHEVALFAPTLGGLAGELQQKGFWVTDDPSALPWVPEVIHGQHYQSTILAILAHPGTPVFWLCHGAVPAEEQPFAAPTIIRRAAVDRVCQYRVMQELGLPASEVEIIPNAVRLDLFPAREIFPEKISRALVYSNYQADDQTLRPLQWACQKENITLDVAGKKSGQPTDRPWELLPRYDLVFGKGRAALEAMACGCSVVLYDAPGVGPAVQATDYAALREWNFGFSLLQAPRYVRLLRERIQRCSPANARELMHLCRAQANQDDLVVRLLECYRETTAQPLTTTPAEWAAFFKKIVPYTSARPDTINYGWNVGRKTPPPVPDPTQVEGLVTVSESLISGEIVAPPPMPFVVGCPRSGTTWLRLMLDAHPDLAMPAETGFIGALSRFAPNQPCTQKQFMSIVQGFPQAHAHFQDYGMESADLENELSQVHPFTISSGLRAFYRLYAARFGKSRVGDKTPCYLGWMHEIERFLPEARFIHLIRDPRGVINSLRRQIFRPEGGIHGAAIYWGNMLQRGRHAGSQRKHYLEIHYEDLVLKKEETLRRICDFAELPWSDAVMHHAEKAGQRLAELQSIVAKDGNVIVPRENRLKLHHPSTQKKLLDRLDSWRTELSVEDRRTIETIAGQTMTDFGYAI